MAVTNIQEQMRLLMEALVRALGGTVPTRADISHPDDYQIQLLEAAVAGAIGGVTFGTLTAESGNARTQSLQLTDATGADLAKRGMVQVYLSNDANGDTIATAGNPAGLAAGTDGLYQQLTQHLAGFFTSEADGDIDVTITNTGSGSVYLVVVLPNGALKVSGAIAFA